MGDAKDKPYCTEAQKDAAYQATCRMAAAGELFDAATGALDALLIIDKAITIGVTRGSIVAHIIDYMDSSPAIRNLQAAIKKAKGD